MRYILLEECCEILDSMRIPITAKDRTVGSFPYYGANGVQDYVGGYLFDDELVLLAEDGGNFGSKDKPIAYRVSGKCWVNNHAHVLKPKAIIDVDYLCFSLMFYNTDGLVNGATRQKLTQSAMRKMKIPYVPIEVQIAIVKKIKKIQSTIMKRQQELDKLDELVKARFVEMFGDVVSNTKNWKTYTWNDVLVIKNGKNQKNVENNKGIYPICGSGGIMSYADDYITESNSVIIGRKGNINNPILMREKFWNVDTAFGLEPNTTILNVDYLFMFCSFFDFEVLNKAVTIPSLTKADLLKIIIPIPPIKLQNQFATFVKQIDKSKFIYKKEL